MRIFHDAAANSSVVGLGYPGQIFLSPGGTGGPDYTCDNGETTHTWEQGADQATGVAGWVPLCNLVLS
ncbi:hypothetical protein CG747_31820 [Streptomyces sp. CB02959]|uniref:hypothetical protein n=1 Tax=Streptomyces sp. CB02959 TaxID=2020330 RepID=UPI000C27E774|nr:hypothetical protein [Streptomyces sp. CB02959]PJN36840.1 hypothetical protein CG747_31820 [Streptomyces sp. CB02959]